VPTTISKFKPMLLELRKALLIKSIFQLKSYLTIGKFQENGKKYIYG